MKNDFEAINKASDSCLAAWLTFMGFCAFTAVAVSATRDVDLLLGGSLLIPIVSASLPLTGFYLVAPSLLLLLHFYLFVQTRLLVERIGQSKDLIAAPPTAIQDLPADLGDGKETNEGTQFAAISPAVLAQWLVRGDKRLQSHAVIAWATIAALPLLVLLILQLRYLPRHDELVTWFHRIVLGLDLLLVGNFLILVRWNDRHVSGVRRAAANGISFSKASLDGLIRRVAKHTYDVVAVVLVLFMLFVATIPGELTEICFNENRADPECRAWWPTAALFEDGLATSAQRVWFSRWWRLDGADLTRLNDSVLEARSPVGLDLRHATLYRAKLQNLDLRSVKLTGANLDSANLAGADISCASNLRLCNNLQGASLHSASLVGAKLDHQDLRQIDFSGAVATGANFSLSNATGANFDDASLEGANFEGALVAGATFRNSRLIGARMTRVGAVAADFTRANLFLAQLASGSFQAASFEVANLVGVDLSDTSWKDFDGARFDSAIVDGAGMRGEARRSDFLLVGFSPLADTPAKAFAGVGIVFGYDRYARFLSGKRKYGSDEQGMPRNIDQSEQRKFFGLKRLVTTTTAILDTVSDGALAADRIRLRWETLQEAVPPESLKTINRMMNTRISPGVTYSQAVTHVMLENWKVLRFATTYAPSSDDAVYRAEYRAAVTRGVCNLLKVMTLEAVRRRYAIRSDVLPAINTRLSVTLNLRLRDEGFRSLYGGPFTISCPQSESESRAGEPH